MIRKSAVYSASSVVRALVCFVTILGAGAATAAQTPGQQNSDQQNAGQQQPAEQQPAQPPAEQQSAQQPSAQQPASSQSGNEQATPEEAATRKRTKPKEYKNWNFNVDGGANTTGGTTKKFVRGGGATFGAGVARNYSKYFGFRLDAQFDDMPLRNTALQLAQATGANNHTYSVMLDPIINVPVNRLWSFYIVFGPSYVHRSGKLDSSTAVPGEACNPFFAWWGRCFAGSLPLNVNFLHESQNQFGYNIGGGIARKVYGNVEVYVEARMVHGDHNNITTDVRPITMGVRW